MKAIEAAEHSDVIQMEGNTPCYKIDNQWYNHGEKICHMHLYGGDYVPLVPKKAYKAGDQVTFSEALNSGMCFTVGGYKHVWRWENEELVFYLNNLWGPSCWNISCFKKSVCTLCDDPSIPPKPTLESLPAWTRCKIKAVNCPIHTFWDVIKKPSGSLMHYCSGNDFEWVNVKLVSIYNPKTEQWESL